MIDAEFDPNQGESMAASEITRIGCSSLLASITAESQMYGAPTRGGCSWLGTV
jgi:hypothetical protein